MRIMLGYKNKLQEKKNYLLFEKFKNKELLIIQELKNMPKQYKIYNITLLYSF